MSPIALRRQLARCRRHLAATAAILALSCAIALHHSGMATGAMHDDHGMSAAVETCLGVMTAVGTAVVAIALGVLALGRRRTGPVLAPGGLPLPARPPVPRARAGPPLLRVLCISRR